MPHKRGESAPWVARAGPAMSGLRLATAAFPSTTAVMLAPANDAMCHDEWPGRALLNGVPIAKNERAASMYSASQVERCTRAIMGIRAYVNRYSADRASTPVPASRD